MHYEGREVCVYWQPTDVRRDGFNASREDMHLGRSINGRIVTSICKKKKLEKHEAHCFARARWKGEEGGRGSMTLCTTTAAVGGLGLDTIVNIPLAFHLDHNLGEGRTAGMFLQSTHHLQEFVELDCARVVQINLSLSNQTAVLVLMQYIFQGGGREGNVKDISNFG